MVKHSKAKKALKGLGARYGIKLRKQYSKVHFTLKLRYVLRHNLFSSLFAMCLVHCLPFDVKCS